MLVTVKLLFAQVMLEAFWEVTNVGAMYYLSFLSLQFIVPPVMIGMIKTSQE
jgi:hypothetical protein